MFYTKTRHEDSGHNKIQLM